MSLEKKLSEFRKALSKASYVVEDVEEIIKQLDAVRAKFLDAVEKLKETTPDEKDGSENKE